MKNKISYVAPTIEIDDDSFINKNVLFASDEDWFYFDGDKDMFDEWFL